MLDTVPSNPARRSAADRNLVNLVEGQRLAVQRALRLLSKEAKASDLRPVEKRKSKHNK